MSDFWLILKWPPFYVLYGVIAAELVTLGVVTLAYKFKLVCKIKPHDFYIRRWLVDPDNSNKPLVVACCVRCDLRVRRRPTMEELNLELNRAMLAGQITATQRFCADVTDYTKD